jgi:TusA-related sulfurtransferase
MTFVKTKLLLEKAADGEVVEVRLKGAEPLRNVPRSAREHGHEILGLSPEDEAGGPDGIHRLRIRVVKGAST